LPTVRLVNPRATAPVSAQDVAAVFNLRESRAGVFPNGKPNAAAVMEHIVDLLGERYGVIKAMSRPRVASFRADSSLVDDFAQNCDWVITGSCD
jgi:hypothetical protein